MDINLALMCGSDIPIPELQLTLHQPTLMEISYIGESSFLTGIQYLMINKNSLNLDNSVLENTNNFQIFMTMMNSKEILDKREEVIQCLQMLFPNYSIILTPGAISFIHEDQPLLIDANNFEILQAVLQKVFSMGGQESQQLNYNPANQKAREIANKLLKGRQKAAKINNKADSSIFSQYISMLSVGLSIPLQNIINLTIYQLFDLVERYQLYISWDIDLRSRMAGAKNDKPLENWMKNIH